MDYAALSTPPVWRNARSSADSDISFCIASSDDLEVPAFLRKQDAGHEPVSLQAIALAVAEHLEHGGQVQGLASHCESLDLHADVRLALEQAVSLGASDGHAWLLLAHWTNARASGLGSASMAATLHPHLDRLDVDLVRGCLKLFDQLLGSVANNGWTLSRTQRLRRSLTRAMP